MKAYRWVPVVAAVGCMALLLSSALPATEPEVENRESAAEPEATAVSGAELFSREWIPNDPRSHGGDGLGPVFNDTSCVACHNQGGAGGGGPASKNVDIVSAFPNSISFHNPRRSPVQNAIRGLFGLPTHNEPAMDPKRMARQREALVKEVGRIHPGFVTSKSVVVHLFSHDENYDQWRRQILGSANMGFGFGGQMSSPGMPVHMHSAQSAAQFEDIAVALSADDVEAFAEETITVDVAEAVEGVQAQAVPQAAHTHFHGENAADIQRFAQAQQIIMQHRQDSGFFGASSNFIGNFTLSTTHRNPTALFGSGVINQVSDKAIEEAAKARFKEFPEISGRVCRLPDDKIGRFGWKSQKATLRDFAMTACAVELGLHVPEHTQSGHPTKPDYRPTGFDMDQEECDALVKYLDELPAPQRMVPTLPQQKAYLQEGQKLFASVGCANCHTENLGSAEGLYSDLLLHDMGEELGDTGDYGVFIPDSPGGEADGAVPPLVMMQQGTVQQAEAAPQQAEESQKEIMGATRLEWRTAPLWGVRDSAPYMHDGRAKNLEQAIAFHGGEGSRSSRMYFALDSKERAKLQAFLRSLAAPSAVATR